MPATQKQLEANRRNSQRSTGPTSPSGKIRSCLNALRHGLTGQVALMPEEDRVAFETFTTEIRNAYHPVGPLETQIAQTIAEDEWRLNRARSVENNWVALGHSMEAGDLDASHSEIHAAMTQARVFWHNPEKFALLTIYEQRISRKVGRNEERLRNLQKERKSAALEAAPQSAADANGFVFSVTNGEKVKPANCMQTDIIESAQIDPAACTQHSSPQMPAIQLPIYPNSIPDCNLSRETRL